MGEKDGGGEEGVKGEEVKQGEEEVASAVGRTFCVTF